MVRQLEIKLPPYKRGYHLITDILKESLGDLPRQGLLNIFIHHTSAGLSINENTDPSVRRDFEYIMDKLVPEKDPKYRHHTEGSDDLPAHIKASIIGESLNIPIKFGELSLGIWQGVYLCEFRNKAESRKLTLTVIG